MIEIKGPKENINVEILLAGSKSISNRVELLNFLFKSKRQILNSSESEDTKLLKEAIHLISNSNAATIDVKHAGTNMRFLTAILSATKGDWILTGSERMKQRPIAALVDALREIGAQITYIEKDGFPPLKIKGDKLKGNKLKVKANISSQYVSALLIIAPFLENGLEIETIGTLVSKPYLKMSIELLKEFGIEVTQNLNFIFVAPKKHQQVQSTEQNFIIESDWSSASYWYSICALSKNSQIHLSSFEANSLQADSVVKNIFENLGVKTVMKGHQLVLENIGKAVDFLEYDCVDCPDIAQTIAVPCFALGIKTHLKGLQTLKIKETDRILALKTELEKCGATVIANDDSIQIEPHLNNLNFNQTIHITTYHDHRMALSFAPLAFIFNSIIVDDELVIDKSYPTFWKDLENVGFNIKIKN